MRIAALLFAHSLATVISLRAAEPGSDIHDLGTAADPANGKVLVWKATTSIRDGQFAGMVNGKPGESEIESVETREIRTVYVSDDERELRVPKWTTVQHETVSGKRQTTETPNALDALKLKARREGGRWILTADGGQNDSPQQRAALQKLEHRLNAPSNLFEGLKAKVGEPFKVDPLRFVKHSGYTDAVRATGSVTGKIKEITERHGEATAIVDLEISVTATLEGADRARRSLTLTGQATFAHSMKTAVDFSVAMTARLKTSGLSLVAPNSFAPFLLEGNLKFESSREYVDP